MGVRRWAGAAASAVLLACLAACAPVPGDALPDGVSVSITQGRSDYSSRTIALSVRNDSDTDITLERAAFESPRFVAPAVWERGTVLRAGTAVDLRVVLPDSECSPADDAEPRVVLDFAVDGDSGTGHVIPADPLGRLATIGGEDCLGQEVAAAAAIVAAPTLQWTPGAHAPASVDLAVTPTGAEGGFRVTAVDDTVLLAVVDDAGAKVESLPLDAAVRGSDAASVITVRFVPNRCDPHVVLEDKRGTFLPLTIEADSGATGIVFVGVSDAVRGTIYDYVGDYCGF